MISSIRACTVTAREYGDGPGRRSTTRVAMPWRANDKASMVPAAPAPTTSTGISEVVLMCSCPRPAAYGPFFGPATYAKLYPPLRPVIVRRLGAEEPYDPCG